MGQSRPLFVYFCSFLITISIQIEKSIDGVLGIQTRGGRIVGTDETMELWRPPFFSLLYPYYNRESGVSDSNFFIQLPLGINLQCLNTMNWRHRLKHFQININQCRCYCN